MLATERDLPAEGSGNEIGDGKRAYVREMFAAIAPRYDFLNHLLSLNFDRLWRRAAVGELRWEQVPDGRYLDLCAGTMDLAAVLATRPAFRGHVIAADFVHPMLVLGKTKAERTSPVTADALELPFPDASFDGVMIGFGLRNLAAIDTGLREMTRVLKPGARLVILEFTTPPRQPLRALYFFYFRRMLPLIGRLVSKHTTAYTYLPESVLSFPEPDSLLEHMRRAGLSDVRYHRMTGGICACHSGRKT
jgi:demethylmenaquinone methyltransferase / 2-methoxy-6-polyprenyl-1,4-benzoquinol methylase